jgi:hypothetical protein
VRRGRRGTPRHLRLRMQCGCIVTIGRRHDPLSECWMPARARAFGAVRVLALVFCLISGCGSRTGLETSEETMPTDASSSEGGDSANDGGDIFCDPDKGPIPASDADASTPQCTQTFPHCVEVAGEWGCCNGPGPYNGPMGSCIFSP